jgi:hypothetical protein
VLSHRRDSTIRSNTGNRWIFPVKSDGVKKKAVKKTWNVGNLEALPDSDSRRAKETATQIEKETMAERKERPRAGEWARREHR